MPAESIGSVGARAPALSQPSDAPEIMAASTSNSNDASPPEALKQFARGRSLLVVGVFGARRRVVDFTGRRGGEHLAQDLNIHEDPLTATNMRDLQIADKLAKGPLLKTDDRSRRQIRDDDRGHGQAARLARSQ